MAINLQHERVILRRVYAFLKSRKLKATAYALEQEARLKLDYWHAANLMGKGRWRAADKYMSSFLGGTDTPAASATLFVIRFEVLVGGLKQERSRAWAERYFRRSLEPLLRNHPDARRCRDACRRAISSDSETLHRIHPDHEEYRSKRILKFIEYFDQNEGILLCTDYHDDNLVRIRQKAVLSLRRYADPPSPHKPSAESIAYNYLQKQKFIEGGQLAPMFF